MFCTGDSNGYCEVLPGIKRKTLVFGEKTLATEFRMERGSTLPVHSHPHEQTGYLVKGRVSLRIGDRTYEAGPGDSWCIPGKVEHSAEILVDSVAVEVFAPVRDEYLPQ